MGHRGAGDNMAWKVQWKAGDVTWEKKGQFIYGCQSDWLAYNKKRGIPIQISRVSTPPETPPWEQTWPGWCLHDLEREFYEDWDLPFSEHQISSYNSR